MNVNSSGNKLSDTQEICSSRSGPHKSMLLISNQIVHIIVKWFVQGNLKSC